MKKYFAFILLFVSTLAFPAPARKVYKTITLADGTQKTVRLVGDEFFHYYEAEDGSAYTETENELFQLTDLSLIRERAASRSEVRNTVRRTKSQSSCLSNYTTDNSTRSGFTGKKKGLVILVNFSDRKMSISQEEYNNFFNLVGYSNFGMGGSVHDYFYDCSYGQFDLGFDVVGPVTVSKQMSYYGTNNSSDNDSHPAEMVIEAVKLADELGVNFKDYDWSGDGLVDQVFVIYAGYGEHAGAPSNTIWPHEYDLSSAKYYGDGTGAVLLDGVYVNTYACSNELKGTNGTIIDGIGTACHEFSHCLGVPDMYDTAGNNFGMNCWDLMDSGCYLNDGNTPCGYTSYERWLSGWLTPTELKDGCEVSDMKSIASTPTAYIIYNQNNKNEYYLLENRQREGWNKYDKGHGLLILHVDYNMVAWRDNVVNNTASHQRMTIIPADNNLSSDRDSQLAGDPWPGTSKKTALTDTSTPAATLYNKNSNGKYFMNAPIENIYENTTKKTISFTFNGGTSIEAPTDIEVTNPTTNGFTAVWSPALLATSYELELVENVTDTTKYNESSLLLSEDFAGFAKGTSDGMSDISGSLDSYTSTSGWSGSKVFTTASHEAKLGTASVPGSLTTPSISSPTGTLFIAFTVRPYGTDNTSLNLSVGGSKSDNISFTEETLYYFTISNCYGPAQLTFAASNASKCRFYISDIRIYDEVPEGYKQQVKSNVQRNVPRKISSSNIYTTTDCYYTFTDLNPVNNYSFRVRTIAGDKTSSWSNYYDVNLNNEPNSIVEPSIDFVSEGVYNMLGQKVNPLNHQRGLFIKNGRKIVK